MKNRKKKLHSKTTARSRRFSLVTVTVASAIVVVAAITVLSKQLGNASASRVTAVNSASSEPGKKYVTVKVAGRDIQVDPQTGQIRPLTPEEAKQLGDGLKTMLNKSTDGLVQVKHPDGSVSMDLQGRFQNVALARINSDGTVEQSCVDEPLAAAQFFGIDPQLVGVEAPKGAPSQPVIRTAAEKVSQ